MSGRRAEASPIQSVPRAATFLGKVLARTAFQARINSLSGWRTHPLETGHNEARKEDWKPRCYASGKAQRTFDIAYRKGTRNSAVGCNHLAAELCHIREPGESGSEELARSQVWVPLDSVRPTGGSQHQRSGSRHHLVDGSIKAEGYSAQAVFLPQATLALCFGDWNRHGN